MGCWQAGHAEAVVVRVTSKCLPSQREIQISLLFPVRNLHLGCPKNRNKFETQVSQEMTFRVEK